MLPYMDWFQSRHRLYILEPIFVTVYLGGVQFIPLFFENNSLPICENFFKEVIDR